MTKDLDKYVFEIADLRFICVRGDDTDRDGAYLELSLVGDDDEEPEPVLEIFCAADTGEMTLSAFAEDVPLEAVEWLIARAKVDLVEDA